MNRSKGICEIFLRLDANFEVGGGHAVRSAALLEKISTPHRLVLFGEGERLLSLFPRADTSFVGAAGSDKLIAELKTRKPDLIFVDHPQPGKSFWSDLRQAAMSVPIVAIDDFGGDVDADLIVNGSIFEEFHRYPRASSASKILTGKDYILLRAPFRQGAWVRPSLPAVTIVIGSGESARDWAFFLLNPAHDMSPWGSVRMIVGKDFPGIDKLSLACSEKKIGLESGVSAETMAKAFSQSSAVLITGGMVLYEAVAFGVPAVVFPQLENLISEVAWFADRKACLSLGFDGGKNWALVKASVESLLAANELGPAMSRHQRSTIDGLGLERAASAIDGLLSR